MLVEVNYFKNPADTAPGKLNKRSFISGRLLKISTDTLLVKKFLFKKRYEVPVSSICQIRKTTNVFILTAVGVGLFTGGYFLSEATGYLIPGAFQLSIPLVVYAYLDNTVFNPMKNVNEKFYKRKNSWVLKVEE